MKPLFSIITINYNNRLGLDKTVTNCINQSSKNYELLIIDGGSIDGSLDIIEQYKDQISYSTSEKDKGIYDAQNKGIVVAKGSYLIFMNSGDCFSDHRVLEDMTSFIEKDSSHGIYYGNTNLIDDEVTTRPLIAPSVLDNDFFYLATLNHQSCFIDQSLFKKYGLYNLNYKICADYDFFLKVYLKEKNTFRYVNRTICDYENYGISASKMLFDLVVSERKQIQADLLSKDQLKKVASLIIQQEGRKSKVFKAVPDSYSLKKVYDSVYFYWYKLRTKRN
ncbi:MAG: glycosyltransferase family 2 protein [Bacteroidota bacterium]